MGITERKQRHKEEIRESIIRAAWNIVQEEGWQALSIRKIADAIEYSIPVIYSHYENKDAILLEFTKKGFHKLNVCLEEAREQEQNPARQLEKMAQAYWDFAFRNKEYYQLMYGLGMPTCETVRQVAELGQFTQLVQDCIKALISAGNKNQAVDSFLKFHTFWSMLHGLVSINLMSQVCPDNLHQLVLQDAVQGFIKNIEN